jgi:dTDP-4-dehydrorhamnose 3,5-epimerase
MMSSPAQPINAIADVLYTPLRAFKDERGQFAETFRAEWFPQVSWAKFQTNRSDSVAGVLRGLHYHFHQVDYWVLTRGRIRVGLADLRPASPTYLQAHTLELSADEPAGLFIPIGVAHGFYALTDCTLTYIVNNYYGDGSDERGVAWDDPQLNVPWQVTTPPLLSPRDVQNRYLADIPADQRPA